jgi:subtilisin family serine protease
VYAIADTGVDYKHPNIAQNYAGARTDGTGTRITSYDHNYAWYDGVRKPVAASGRTQSRCGVASGEPCDDQGHGTHVTSTAVGQDGIGVAPGARWMACRNMDNGLGAPVTYLLCLNFFLAPHESGCSVWTRLGRCQTTFFDYGRIDVERGVKVCMELCAAFK